MGMEDVAGSYEAFVSSYGRYLVVPVWLIAIACVLIIHYVAWHRNGRIGPYQVPLVGCAWQFYTNSQRINEYKAELLESFGTLQLYVYFRQATYISSPALLEHVLKTKVSVYEKGEDEERRMKGLLGRGVLNTDGLEWVAQRKLLATHLVSPAFRAFRIACFQQKATAFARILMDRHEHNLTVDIQALCMRLALDTSCLVACGEDPASLAPLLPASAMVRALASVAHAQALRDYPSLLTQISELLGMGSAFALGSAARTIRKFVRQAVKDRRSDIATPGKDSQGDLVSTLLGEGGVVEELSEGQITERLTDAAVNLIVASQGPVACALAWVFYELSQNPEIDEQLYEEIQRVTRSAGIDTASGVGEEQLAELASGLTSETVRPSQMPFMHAVISESLRLHTPVPEVCRLANKKDELPDGTQLSSARVALCHFATCRSEAAWGSNALEFRPERWISQGKFQEESPFKFPAFHAGPRMCLGRDIAYVQMKILLTVVLSLFRVRVVAGQTTTQGVSTILFFKDGLEVTLEER